MHVFHPGSISLGSFVTMRIGRETAPEAPVDELHLVPRPRSCSAGLDAHPVVQAVHEPWNVEQRLRRRHVPAPRP